ncbi:hypothetical protein [Shewanella sp. HL-SH2]|uniref:hypothetical protein n=1 Tax=Shewanella sp. HL-SH2 TaxID=3436238 RepID=UPI003EBD5268
MNYSEFLINIEEVGYSRQGKSCAFCNIGEWTIGFIGLSGKFQSNGSKAYVVCARPTEFEFMTSPNKQFSTEPMEYPLKLTLESFTEKLEYESNLLRFDYDRIGTESDWSDLFKLIANDLPIALEKLKVTGLITQITKSSELGYIEKVWLGLKNA